MMNDEQWIKLDISAPMHVFEELFNQVFPENYRTLPDGTNAFNEMLKKLATFNDVVLTSLEDAIVEYVEKNPGCTSGSIYGVRHQSPEFTSEMYSTAMKNVRRTRVTVVRGPNNSKLHYVKDDESDGK